MGQLGHLSPQESVAVGILVGLVSTSVQSLGLTLQRKSHILEDEKADDEYRRPAFRRRRWQLGMFMFIVSNVAGSTIQITTLPLPVLSTLQAAGLVFNSICATLILGEPFTRWSLLGTVLVCVGAILIAAFGAIAEKAHDLNQLLNLLARRQFVVWMISQAILVVLIILCAKMIKYLRPWAHHAPKTRLLRGMAYGSVSGILSAHSLLVAKSAVELLVRTIKDRNNQFRQWQSWILLLGLLTLALTQLYYLHRGLKLCSTSVLYPFVFCIYNIIAILDGLIYFDQGSRLTTLHALLTALGTFVLLSGVLALSWRLTDGDPRPVPPNALAPGLGLVTEENEEEHSGTDSSHAGSDDEETALLGKESKPRYGHDSLHVNKGNERGCRSHRRTSNSIRHAHAESMNLRSTSNPSSRRITPSLLFDSNDTENASVGGINHDTYPLSQTTLKRSSTGRLYRTIRSGHRRSTHSSGTSVTGNMHEQRVRSARRRSTAGQTSRQEPWWSWTNWWSTVDLPRDVGRTVSGSRPMSGQIQTKTTAQTSLMERPADTPRRFSA